MYVVSQSSGTVYRYDWLTGNCLSTINTGLNGLGGVLYDKSNNTLYASEFTTDFTGYRIIEYNAATGAQIGVLNVSGASGLANMALGSDGSLYVSSFSFSNGTVYKYNSSTGVFTPLSGSFLGASGLAFDSSGNLDVVGMMTFNVYQFNSSGTAVGDLISNSGGLYFPCDIIIDPDGNILVSSMGDSNSNGYIGKYNSTTGAAINTSFISTIVEPTALAIEPALWTGGASGTGWKNSANWHGTPPVYQGDVRFGSIGTGGHATNNNDFDSGTQFNGITFIAGAPSFKLQGNTIKLGGPVINQSDNDQEIDLDMELVLGGGSFDTGDHNITVGGLISGDGSLTKKGSGTLSLVGGVKYTGSTIVTAGTLDIAGPLTDSPTIIVEGENSELLAQSIVADTLTIGSGTISGGATADADLKAVPEPGAMALLATAGWLAPLVFLSRRRKT
jgi:autotransporter-associated beta strand protein